jgi:hypothetical protein
LPTEGDVRVVGYGKASRRRTLEYYRGLRQRSHPPPDGRKVPDEKKPVLQMKEE